MNLLTGAQTIDKLIGHSVTYADAHMCMAMCEGLDGLHQGNLMVDVPVPINDSNRYSFSEPPQLQEEGCESVVRGVEGV